MSDIDNESEIVDIVGEGEVEIPKKRIVITILGDKKTGKTTTMQTIKAINVNRHYIPSKEVEEYILNVDNIEIQVYVTIGDDKTENDEYIHYSDYCVVFLDEYNGSITDTIIKYNNRIKKIKEYDYPIEIYYAKSKHDKISIILKIINIIRQKNTF